MVYFIDYRHGLHGKYKTMKLGYFSEEDDYNVLTFSTERSITNQKNQNLIHGSNQIRIDSLKEVKMHMHKGHVRFTPEGVDWRSIDCFSCHGVTLRRWQEDCFINTQTAGSCTVIKNWSAHNYLASMDLLPSTANSIPDGVTRTAGRK